MIQQLRVLPTFILILAALAGPSALGNRDFETARPKTGRQPASLERRPSSVVEDTIKLALGFDRGALNFGGEYEARKGTTGVSAYFLIGSEASSAGKPGVTVLGGAMPIYVFDNRQHHFVVSPGVGLYMLKTAASTEMGLGPHLKFATGHRLGQNTRFGFEYLIMANAFNEKAGAGQSLFYLTLGMSL